MRPGTGIGGDLGDVRADDLEMGEEIVGQRLGDAAADDVEAALSIGEKAEIPVPKGTMSFEIIEIRFEE